MEETLSLPSPKPSRKKKNLGLILAGLILVAALGIFWFLQRGIVSSESAQVEGHSFVLSAPIHGRVMAVHVVEGQEVPYGALLLSMDEAPLLLALRDAEANFELALQGKAPQPGQDADTARLMEDLSLQVQQHRNAIQTNQQYLEHWTAEHAKAMLVLRSPLADEESRSRAVNEEAYARGQMEQARSMVDSINRQRTDTEARLQRLRQSTGGSLSPEKQVQLWQARVVQAQADLANAGIYAPDNGVVTGLNVREGQMVTYGQPLMNLAAGGGMDGGYWVTARFDSKALGLRVGQPCKVKLESGETVDGHIATIIPEARGYTVKVALGTDLPVGITPGLGAVVSARAAS